MQLPAGVDEALVKTFIQPEKFSVKDCNFLNKMLTVRPTYKPNSDRIINIQYYMNENFGVLTQQLIQTKGLLRKQKVEIDEMLFQFLKLLALKLADRNKKFCVSYGRIMSSRILRKRIMLSVKDPFVKYINHGSSLKG